MSGLEAGELGVESPRPAVRRPLKLTRKDLLWGAWLIGLGGVLGHLAGRVWMAIWEPPAGEVMGNRWYPLDWVNGYGADFDAIATGAIVAAVTGLLLGLVAVLVAKAQPLVVVVATLLGGLLGASLMYLYASAGAPADPMVLAETAADGTLLSGTLPKIGVSVLACLPFAAQVVVALRLVLARR